MRRRPRMLATAFVLGLGLILTLVACGLVSGIDDYALSDRPDEQGDGSTTTNVDGTTSGDGSSNLDGTSATDTRPCTNLCLRQRVCAAPGTTTSVSGVVLDPAGLRPLYNVIVYVPNAPVATITPGLSPPTCDRCGTVSGEPLVSTLTKSDGSFKLDNVPVGPNVPLVIQVGKWRRQVTIPNVAECVDTPLDPTTTPTRLPKNQSEGDMPQIAIATGGADFMECLARKFGIDDAEFTPSTGAGRVHMFAGSGLSGDATKAFADGGTPFAPATDLWGTATTPASLMKYDVVLLSCEAQTAPPLKPLEALEAMKAFANAGGRIMANHYHRYWFDTSMSDVDPAGPQPSPFEPFASFVFRDIPNAPVIGTVNKTFPKGKALDEWLALPSVSALDAGAFVITGPRHTVDAVNPALTTSWLTSLDDGGAGLPMIENVQVMTTNTPIPAPDAQKCGRIFYTDLHTRTNDSHVPFPNGCLSGAPNAQELALEFMFFDLVSCVQNDKVAPAPPQ